MNFWNLEQAEDINAKIATLPIAESKPIFDEKGNEIEGYKRTIVNNKVIDIPTDQYVLKQHNEAFRPVIEGLTISGVRQFNFCLWSTQTRAKLAILVGEAADGVKFGFTIANSFDRTSSINYGFKAQKNETTMEIVEKEHVLVWGLRQVCTNGMVMKVPLKTCKYMDAQLVTRVKELLNHKTNIVHKGENVNAQIQNMQFITEAFMLLKNPIGLMIEDAKLQYLHGLDARNMLTKYIGKRRIEWFLAQYNDEEPTLWGLYNSITAIASHNPEMRTGERENLLLKAGTMLEQELTN